MITVFVHNHKECGYFKYHIAYAEANIKQ